MRSRYLLAVVSVVLAFGGITACGEDAGTPGPSPSPSPAATSPSPTASGDQVDALVYLTRGEQVGVGGRRVEVVGGAVARASMEALLEGPTALEAAAGLATQIPAGTSLLDLAVQDGVATVDLSGAFDDGGGSLSMQLRVAQVVHTLTQFDTITAVGFRIDGEPVQAVGGEGVLVDPPVGRADFEGVAPQVLLETVWPGAVVSSPIPFAGTANTFEATVLWRVERPDGSTVGEGFVTATSGTGTRGTFDGALDLGSFTGPAVLVTGGDNARGDGGFAGEYSLPFTVT